MLQECLGIELDLARGRAESSRYPLVIDCRVLGIAGLERHPDPAGGGAQGLHREARRTELVPVRCLDVTLPKEFSEPEPGCQIEHDLCVGAGLAARRNNARPQLHQRLRFGTDVKTDLERFPLEWRGHR